MKRDEITKEGEAMSYSTVSVKQACVITHVAFEDLGTLEQYLQNFGYEILYLQAGVDCLKNLIVSPPPLLIILGGPISVYDSHNYPFLEDESNIIKSRIQHNLETIGICLGAQLIAYSLGSKIYPGNKEIGWYRVSNTSPGKEDFFDCFTKDPVFHWHGDTFDLPRGAVLKLKSHLCAHQAFTYGEKILALQFHPEITLKNLERWLIGHAFELSKEKINIINLRRQAELYIPQLAEASAKFWTSWFTK